MMRATLLAFALLLSAPAALADGLLLSTDPDYPGSLLRNRVTRVDVRIDGLIAQTTAYFEFVNEWDRETDAVFSFPLPDDARAVRMLYHYNGVVYEAVLEVREQATNPGTGEGGIAAEINEYLGRNGIRMHLASIPAGEIQAVEITYVETLDADTQTVEYTYPLDTGTFVRHDLDLIEFNVEIESNLEIQSAAILSHAGARTVESGANRVVLKYQESKGYLAQDFEMSYSVVPDGVTLDFYSYLPTGGDHGYLTTIARPDSLADGALPRQVVFVVNNSSRLSAGLGPSVAAVKHALAALKSEDRFNILAYNSTVQTFRSGLVAPSAGEIAAAEAFLDGLTTRNANELETALMRALAEFGSIPEGTSAAILVFTDGRASLDPQEVAVANTQGVGIYPVGTGDVDRARLEMLADLNRGFVTYLGDGENVADGLRRVTDQIGVAVVQDPVFEFTGTEVTHILPAQISTLFATRPVAVSARYATSASGTVTLSGTGASGPVAYATDIDYAQGPEKWFARVLWARAAIDQLEREIAVYGATEALKDSVIALSLQYNIRSKYTAYVADYVNV
ncbi:MAG: VWA domain-containing protein, partial [Rhodothermales bacterium]|nr:VWA domain-containing protein [Rhodothermales bacterium]